MREHIFKRCVAAVAAVCAAAALVLSAPDAFAAQAYTFYPTPQEVSYSSGEVVLSDTVDIVRGKGIDSETVARVEESLKLKAVKSHMAEAPKGVAGNVEVLVGVYGSDDVVNSWVRDNLKVPSQELFKKTDAYWMDVVPETASTPARIVLLGKDTDAAYYAATTLFQIAQQASARSISVLTVKDWADVETRGFIEGYYGNPWSAEDRAELMRFGGYFKLNAYVYAPKDDPKHNQHWRELYTKEELDKISELAKAGNESKCRFIYALHPFMNDPIKFGSSYDKDLADLKAKYLQVIDAGCRQIMVSADDATDPGSVNYKRLLSDLTNWIHGLQRMKNEDGTAKYPGLKDVIPFVSANYMNAGESWYDQLPSNVRPIMTGTKVWGRADKATINQFTKKSGGVKPFMWINWPCTDNTRDSLSMGGYENALGVDVDPGSLLGCVINPMQQSEPSKVGIFINADFSWNNWTSMSHADKVWADSFSYVESNSPKETAASRALRNLSEHMKQYQGGGETFESRESESAKPMLNAFVSKLKTGTVGASDVDEVEAFFTDLASSVDAYSEGAENASLRRQIDPWVGFWRDGAAAAKHYLAAIRAHLADDEDAMTVEYTQGRDLFKGSLRHGYDYVGATQYARGGKRAVWPVVEAMGAYLKPLAAGYTDTVDVVASVSLDKLGTSGILSNVVDGDESTAAHFSGSNPTTNVNPGDSLTVTYEPYKLADRIEFVQSVPVSRPQDVLKDALLEYTTDGKTWTELAHLNGDAKQIVKLPEAMKIKGVRVTNKEYYGGYWQINEIAALSPAVDPAMKFESSSPIDGNHALENMGDGALETYWRPSGRTGSMSAALVNPFIDGKPRDLIRFVSFGKPSGAKVTATVFTDAKHEATREVELGELNRSVTEFSISKTVGKGCYGIKSVELSWDGAAPLISEIVPLDETFVPQPNDSQTPEGNGSRPQKPAYSNSQNGPVRPAPRPAVGRPATGVLAQTGDLSLVGIAASVVAAVACFAVALIRRNHA